jgi:Holliday junction resolvase RusA-like endonuclease
MPSFSFVVPGNPVAKGRPRLGRGRRAFTPQRTLDYEALVKQSCLPCIPENWDVTCEYEVDIRLYFENLRLPDIDNVAKTIDGLNPKVKRKARVVVSRETPFVWADDKQVRKLTVERFIDRQNPRMEVTISQCPQQTKPPRSPSAKPRSRPSSP